MGAYHKINGVLASRHGSAIHRPPLYCDVTEQPLGPHNQELGHPNILRDACGHHLQARRQERVRLVGGLSGSKLEEAVWVVAGWDGNNTGGSGGIDAGTARVGGPDQAVVREREVRNEDDLKFFEHLWRQVIHSVESESLGERKNQKKKIAKTGGRSGIDANVSHICGVNKAVLQKWETWNEDDNKFLWYLQRQIVCHVEVNSLRKKTLAFQNKNFISNN